MDERQRYREVLSINRAIASAEDYDEVLRLVVDRTAAFTRATACLLLLSQEDGLARVVRSVGIEPAKAARLAVAPTERMDVELCDLLGFQARDGFVGVPVIGKEGLMGVLAVYREGPHAVGVHHDDELLISAFADQAAIALDNAERVRRLEASRERALLLASMTQDLNKGVELREVVDVAVRRGAEILGRKDGSLFLLEPDRQHARGFSEVGEKGRLHLVVTLEDLPNTRRAVESGQPRYFTLEEAGGGEREWMRRHGVCAALVVPLLLERECIGFLFVNYESQDRPTPDEVEFVNIVAVQCALAIGRARAYEAERSARSEAERIAAALGESDERFRVAFQTSPDWISISRIQDGVYVAVNEAFLKATGWSEAEVIGRSARDIDLWEDQAERARLVETLKRNGHVQNLEVSLRARDGRFVPGLVSARLIKLNGESVLLAITRDITEWKRAQEEIRQNESRLGAFVESDVIGILFGDVDGRVYDCNRELTRIIGRSREDVLAGKVSWVDITPPEDLPLDEVALAEAAVRGRCRHYEKHFVRPDGTRVPVQVGFVLLEPDRRRSIAFILDIADRKRAEEALRRTDAFYRAVHKGSPDFWSVLDARGQETFVSGGASAVVGWTEPELLNQVAFRNVHLDDRERLLSAFRAVRDEPGGIGRERYRFRHKDGSWRVLETVARNLLHDPDVRGIVVNRRDVTEQQRLEDQFRQGQKLESVGRLAGGIAHDFNNLLTVILSCAEVLKREAELTSTAALEDIEDIRTAGKRAAELTRQLLAFARKQVIAPVPLDLNELVHGTEKLFRRVLGEDIELVTTLQPALWPVRCDPGQTEQVILNLAVNARDAMPCGGKLTIETSNLDVDAAHPATLTGVPPGPYVRLAVHDTGAGMSAEVKARVFEPFFTTKPVGKGTGLGLATVYGIVSQSGGFILVESEPGGGATFELLFPRINEDAHALEARAPEISSTGTETILVVEDDPQVREVTVRSLRSGGYAVLSASSGRQALDVAAGEPGSLHLLLTDVVMPGLDARAVADELCRRHPGLRVLYVSGHAQEVIVSRGVLDPGIAFLPKPFTAASLLARVRTVLDAV